MVIVQFADVTVDFSLVGAITVYSGGCMVHFRDNRQPIACKMPYEEAVRVWMASEPNVKLAVAESKPGPGKRKVVDGGGVAV